MAEQKTKKQTVKQSSRGAYYARQFFVTKANKERREKRRKRLTSKPSIMLRALLRVKRNIDKGIPRPATLKKRRLAALAAIKPKPAVKT